MEASTAREGKQTYTATKKEEMQSRQAVPPKNDDLHYELTPLGSAHRCITEQAVERAILSKSVRKDPSPDMLSVGAIRLLERLGKQRIVGLRKAAIRTGRHPGVWKPVSGAVIR